MEQAILTFLGTLSWPQLACVGLLMTIATLGALCAGDDSDAGWFGGDSGSDGGD